MPYLKVKSFCNQSGQYYTSNELGLARMATWSYLNQNHLTLRVITSEPECERDINTSLQCHALMVFIILEVILVINSLKML